MRIAIVFGTVLIILMLIQELHTKSTPLNEMSRSSRNFRITEIKSLLSHYTGQRCDDLVDQIGETANGIKAGMLLVTIIFASKTNTSESDWERIISGERALLTDVERVLINSIPKTDDEELRVEKMLKILAMTRMSSEDFRHVIQILNDCSDSSSVDQMIQGIIKAIATVISACSGQSYGHVWTWFPEFFKRLHSTDRFYENLAGDNEKFI